MKEVRTWITWASSLWTLRRISTYLMALSAMLYAGPLAAEKIYKSTNARGEVVFSDEPPPNAVNVEQIEVQPAPTESEHREAVQRSNRMGTMADEMESARRERSAAPAPAEPQAEQVPAVETHVDGDYTDEQRRRRAIAGERPPQVEHPAQARAVPHAGGGNR